MKTITNLTDVKTPALSGAGLVNANVKVGRRGDKDLVLKPGESMGLSEREFRMADLSRLLRVGAVCVGAPPASYVAAKPKPAEPPSSGPVSAPVSAPAPIVEEPVSDDTVEETPSRRKNRNK